MNNPVMPAADAIGRPNGGLVGAVQEFAAQYAAAILAAVCAATIFFPGNEFLPVPWQFDDYFNLSGYLHYLHYPQGFRNAFLHARPVSTNAIWCLGAAGETTFYLVMFFLTALLPVVTVRLALRLFRCRPGPWVAIWLAAAVSFCTFLAEESPWFYRYTGIMTNLTSVTAGMLATCCYCRFLDGKKSALAVGCLLFFVTAFAKEDMLLFVPLFVTADWCIFRLTNKKLASVRSLAFVYGSFAVVGAILFFWNTWVIFSPFTAGVDSAYKQDWTPSRLLMLVWGYADASRTPRVVFIALAVAAGLGLLRRGHRIAALSSILLGMSLILPYAVVQKFSGYYCLNWLPIVTALSLVGIAVAWRPFAPGRLSIVPWIVPVAIVVTAVLVSHSAAGRRRELMMSLNRDQENNSYMIQQVLRHREEFANAKTVALQGIDDVVSPWYFSDARYINWKLGTDTNWLLVARPKSLVDKRMTTGWLKDGHTAVISERDLAAHPGIPILEFDKSLNLTVHVSGKQ